MRATIPDHSTPPPRDRSLHSERACPRTNNQESEKEREGERERERRWRPSLKLHQAMPRSGRRSSRRSAPSATPPRKAPATSKVRSLPGCSSVPSPCRRVWLPPRVERFWSRAIHLAFFAPRRRSAVRSSRAEVPCAGPAGRSERFDGGWLDPFRWQRASRARVPRACLN